MTIQRIFCDKLNNHYQFYLKFNRITNRFFHFLKILIKKIIKLKKGLFIYTNKLIINGQH